VWEALDEDLPYVFRDGTRRVVPPADTLRRVGALAPVMGITRLADVTGLDCIGVPVVMACRPNARSLSVAQGKGPTLEAARASALMESVELFHAEHVIQPLLLGSVEEIRYRRTIVDVARLPRANDVALERDRPIMWIEGIEIGSRAPTWVPFESVHTAYTAAVDVPATRSLAMSSSGLASGNHLLEAILHGVLEAVERDAMALLTLASDDARAARRVDPATIQDPGCVALLERFAAAGADVVIWDATTELGLPTFSAILFDRDASSPRALFAANGSGSHASRAIALSRALTEAAQSRLTWISGARDDLARTTFRIARDVDQLAALRALASASATRPFSAAPTFEGETVGDDLAHARRALADAGFAEIVVVDLARPELRVDVVRVIVPGLEGNVEDGSSRPSPRARARVAALDPGAGGGHT
jgi:ribosomal protein S12 methylthiotransferase accessory factor